MEEIVSGEEAFLAIDLGFDSHRELGLTRQEAEAQLILAPGQRLAVLGQAIKFHWPGIEKRRSQERWIGDRNRHAIQGPQLWLVALEDRVHAVVVVEMSMAAQHHFELAQ